MAVKLHRCRFEWLKTGPCWKVEKALKDMGIDYEVAPGPSRPSKRHEMIEHTGQALYPGIECRPPATVARSEDEERPAVASLPHVPSDLTV